MYNKTSVWHTEVYALCCVIRAYFPAVVIEIYRFLLNSTFHSIFIFYGRVEFTSCCSTVSKVLVPMQWLVKFTGCHGMVPTFLFVCPPPSHKYSKIYKVSNNLSLLIQGYIAGGDSTNDL